MKNLDIRVRVSDSGLKYSDIAGELKVSRVWLSTLMRHELSPENWERIMKAITALEAKRGIKR